MDIQHLVDRLEDLIDEGRHMPFSRFTMIDEERVLEIIDQMRISIPEEIEKANRILLQRDRVLAQANEEAARILQQARVKGEEMLDQDINVQAAQNRAANLIEEARQQADQVRRDADAYVVQVLGQLEQMLTRNLNTVRNGINAVHHQPPTAAEIQSDPITASEDGQLSFPQVNMPDSVEVPDDMPQRPAISVRRRSNED